MIQQVSVLMITPQARWCHLSITTCDLMGPYGLGGVFKTSIRMIYRIYMDLWVEQLGAAMDVPSGPGALCEVMDLVLDVHDSQGNARPLRSARGAQIRGNRRCPRWASFFGNHQPVSIDYP